jgi:flagellar biosynthesis protein FlhF
MDLRTYRGKSMAECLAEVKKDLGSEAVILRTRTLRTGGVLGIASKPIVEITASTSAPVMTSEQRRARARAAAGVADRPVESGGVATAPPDPGGPGSPVHATDDESPAAVLERLSRPPSPGRGSDRVPTPPRRLAPPRPSRPVSVTPNGNAASSKLEPTDVDLHPQGPDAQAALEAELGAIRRLMGQVLQTTRSTAVHLTRSGARDAAITSGGLPDALFNDYTGMLDNGVPAEIADELAASVRAELSPAELADPQIVRQTLTRRLAERIKVAPPIATPRTGEPARGVAFVGPTGVGKTTTIAKLAATLKLRHGRRVGLITSDTYRIAAVEQLRTYAGIIGLPVKVALTMPEMSQARAALADCDVVLIDTAGRSPGDEGRLGELAGFLEAAAPDETHLVLSANTSERQLARVAERFARLAPDRLVLSKLDETDGLGVIVAACQHTGLPLSYVSTGQEVPDDFEPAHAERLARLALAGEGHA